MTLTIPLRLEGRYIIDSNGVGIAMLCNEIPTYRECGEAIVDAVNSQAAHADLLTAAKGLLRFNEELCDDIGVSKHYPSAEKARAAIAKAEQSR